MALASEDDPNDLPYFMDVRRDPHIWNQRHRLGGQRAHRRTRVLRHR